MKRGVLIVLGVVLLVGGMALAAGGGIVAAVFGPDGSLSTPAARVTGTGVALVVEDIAIDASIPVPGGVGSLTVSVSSPERRPMFAGVARSDDVDVYLTGAAYDVVMLAPGGEAQTRPVPGTQQPPTPASQSFWLRQSVGSPAQLTATTAPDTTLVIMNAAATPGVAADLVVTLTVARVWTISWMVVGAGLLLVVLGGVSLWRAVIAARRPAATPRHVAGDTSGATVLPGAEAEPGAVAVVESAAPEPDTPTGEYAVEPESTDSDG